MAWIRELLRASVFTVLVTIWVPLVASTPWAGVGDRILKLCPCELLLLYRDWLSWYLWQCNEWLRPVLTKDTVLGTRGEGTGAAVAKPGEKEAHQLSEPWIGRAQSDVRQHEFNQTRAVKSPMVLTSSRGLR